MAQLYVQAYKEMVEKNLDLFAEFQTIHDLYKSDQQSNQAKFDEIGKQIVRIISDAENRLCNKMESSNRGKYSSNLADKFRSEVKLHFPLIDFVGVKVS